MKLDELIFRGILTLAGASLGINSYFVKAKVDEISADIKSLSASYYQLRIENAARDALLNGVGNRLEVCENRLSGLDDRMRAVEVKVGFRGR